MLYLLFSRIDVFSQGNLQYPKKISTLTMEEQEEEQTVLKKSLFYYLLMCLKSARRVAKNDVASDLGYTVCSGMSVPIFRVIMVCKYGPVSDTKLDTTTNQMWNLATAYLKEYSKGYSSYGADTKSI